MVSLTIEFWCFPIKWLIIADMIKIQNSKISKCEFYWFPLIAFFFATLSSKARKQISPPPHKKIIIWINKIFGKVLPMFSHILAHKKMKLKDRYLLQIVELEKISLLLQPYILKIIMECLILCMSMCSSVLT